MLSVTYSTLLFLLMHHHLGCSSPDLASRLRTAQLPTFPALDVSPRVALAEGSAHPFHALIHALGGPRTRPRPGLGGRRGRGDHFEQARGVGSVCRAVRQHHHGGGGSAAAWISPAREAVCTDVGVDGRDIDLVHHHHGLLVGLFGGFSSPRAGSGAALGALADAVRLRCIVCGLE